jgi:hypothetical protein
VSISQVQEALKNMSGDELAQVQNAIILASDSDPTEAVAAMALVSEEVDIRQNEGIGRKAERCWNRHGEKVGLVAIGALLGVWVGD